MVLAASKEIAAIGSLHRVPLIDTHFPTVRNVNTCAILRSPTDRNAVPTHHHNVNASHRSAALAAAASTMSKTASPFSTTSALILGEVEHTLAAVSDEQAAAAIDLILAARSVFFIGAGRSGLALKMATMRMMHLGLTAYAVGEVVTPAIASGDVLVVASGSGTTSGPVHAAEIARKVGADVIALTTAPTSPLGALSTAIVTIQAAVKHDERSGISQQYAGSLFEQAVLITMDVLFDMLWHRRGEAAEVLWKRHANLE